MDRSERGLRRLSVDEGEALIHPLSREYRWVCAVDEAHSVLRKLKPTADIEFFRIGFRAECRGQR